MQTLFSKPIVVVGQMKILKRLYYMLAKKPIPAELRTETEISQEEYFKKRSWENTIIAKNTIIRDKIKYLATCADEMIPILLSNGYQLKSIKFQMHKYNQGGSDFGVYYRVIIYPADDRPVYFEAWKHTHKNFYYRKNAISKSIKNIAKKYGVNTCFMELRKSTSVETVEEKDMMKDGYHMLEHEIDPAAEEVEFGI